MINCILNSMLNSILNSILNSSGSYEYLIIYGYNFGGLTKTSTSQVIVIVLFN